MMDAGTQNKKIRNLNASLMAGDYDVVEQSDHSVATDVARVYFRNLAEHLVDEMADAHAVVGCVAWLTEPLILDALKDLKIGASIIVQKEDFLRPDAGSDPNHSRLRRQYQALRGLDRWQFQGEILGEMSVYGDSTIHPVRCVGSLSRNKRLASPRMHNKFIVMCRSGCLLRECADGSQDELWEQLMPYRVWTGSYNFTINGGYCLENAVVFEEKTIVLAYFREYQQIAALSEPLNWNAEWVEPEWRFGT